MDYGNVKKREPSKVKPLQPYNSISQTSERHELNKKYKQEIKEKLLTGKSKRETCFALSKEEIEKKYFMR